VVQAPVFACSWNHVTEVGGRKFCEIGSEGCHAKWRGLCGCDPAIRQNIRISAAQCTHTITFIKQVPRGTVTFVCLKIYNVSEITVKKSILQSSNCWLPQKMPVQTSTASTLKVNKMYYIRTLNVMDVSTSMGSYELLFAMNVVLTNMGLLTFYLSITEIVQYVTPTV